MDYLLKPPSSLEVINQNGKTKFENILIKILYKQPLEQIDVSIMNEVIVYYKNQFDCFSSLNLSEMNVSAIKDLRSHLDEIINFNVLLQSDFNFKYLYRVTRVKEEFIENGRLKQLIYLLPPSIELSKSWNLYNRASSPASVVFYASFFPDVAISEIKPDINERIIITKWINKNNKPFTSFLISNNYQTKSKLLNRGNKAIEMLGESLNPLFFELIKVFQGFLSKEFVKDCKIKSQNRFEYFFSAYFSDKLFHHGNKNSIAENDPSKIIKSFDCIIYPSVAFNHKEENIAITSKSVIENLLPESIVEYEILESYNEKIFKPYNKKYIRNMISLKNGKIEWNDD